ncbi:unnamed protein product, partial [Phaeothamnion confervicola]
MASLRCLFPSALLTLAFLSTVTRADFRTLCPLLVSAKMDPIVMPGQVSGHNHDIVGSVAFGQTTRKHMMRISPSTCSIIGDFSNYWVPSIYRTDGGKKEKLPVFIRAYYLTGTSDSTHVDVSQFPRNISMVMGDASGNTKFGDPSFDHIEFICVGANDNNGDNKISNSGFLDNGTCPGGLRILYFFPNCWSGAPYQADQSHVAYADKVRIESGGTCPPSHPRRIFTVRLEYEVATPQSWKGPAPFVLSSGPLNTAHADATLVWSETVMTKLEKTCRNL